MSTPRISIGLPVYNGGEDLRRALDALLAQTWSDFEIVISDNGSTDSVTRAIVDRYAARDSRIRAFHQPVNLGATANFLFVLAEARAPYFMWCAHDDYWEPQSLAALVAGLDQQPEAVLATGSTILHKETRTGQIRERLIPAAFAAACQSQQSPASAAGITTSATDSATSRWALLSQFLRHRACIWLYGAYRTDWLRSKVDELTEYQTEAADLQWLFGVMLSQTLVGCPAATLHYQDAHRKRHKTFRYRMTVAGQTGYYLARQVRRHLPWTAWPRGLLYVLWAVHEFHLKRGNPFNTLLHTAKVAIFGSMFALSDLVRRVLSGRPQQTACHH